MRNSRLAWAGIGADGIAAASTASAAGVASTGVSSTGSVVSSVSGSVSADAATRVMVAPLNAAMGTNDNSIQSAAVTIMRP